MQNCNSLIKFPSSLSCCYFSQTFQEPLYIMSRIGDEYQVAGITPLSEFDGVTSTKPRSSKLKTNLKPHLCVHERTTIFQANYSVKLTTISLQYLSISTTRTNNYTIHTTISTNTPKHTQTNHNTQQIQLHDALRVA